ncbi:hypothetical protein [Marinibactrum halimedae]|uniref:Uncharacterized protein n=1 Tax=Marinibactrum halimedae TaxID=1444977 RepID=A0AA37T6T8_9GAMM|nr:hypothetical protein [Marinibactrum halimedae]MCD9461132.1 hypothetical protein [Marinibactrum halimedae]GLS24640.1 hypothetical protein GCM10007877_03540 [Marinibactrum halimedae]
MSKRTRPTSPEKPAKKFKSSTADNLHNLAIALHSHTASEIVETTLANKNSVCWDWVFNGAQSKSFNDPRVLICGYLNHTITDTELEKITAKEDSIIKKLEPTREKFYRSDRLQNDYKEACEKVVEACMSLSDIQVDESSPLRIKYYYDLKAVFFQHIEFDYNKGMYGMTITKGGGELLKAFNGDSLVSGNPPSATIGVDISSLKPAHITCIADLLKNARKNV